VSHFLYDSCPGSAPVPFARSHGAGAGPAVPARCPKRLGLLWSRGLPRYVTSIEAFLAPGSNLGGKERPHVVLSAFIPRSILRGRPRPLPARRRLAQRLRAARRTGPASLPGRRRRLRRLRTLRLQPRRRPLGLPLPGPRADKSCRAAALRVLVLAVVLQRGPCSSDTACIAAPAPNCPPPCCGASPTTSPTSWRRPWPEHWLWKGRHVHLVDGTTVTAPDTPENQAAYPQPPGQRPASASP